MITNKSNGEHGLNEQQRFYDCAVEYRYFKRKRPNSLGGNNIS